MPARRNLFKSAGATAPGVAMAGVTHAGIAPPSDLEPHEAGHLQALTMALARAAATPLQDRAHDPHRHHRLGPSRARLSVALPQRSAPGLGQHRADQPLAQPHA